MARAKRTVDNVRDELTDLIIAIDRSTKTAGSSLQQIDIVALQPNIHAAFEVVAQQLASIQQKIQPLHERSHELYVEAITDGLTRLLNRGYFETVIKPRIERFQKTAILLTDVDHFGMYNNTYGHQQGDIALRTVADVVQATAKTKFIARYGGEEFSIILAEYENSRNDAKQAAEAIRQRVEQAIIKPWSIEEVTRYLVKKYGNARTFRSQLSHFFEKSQSAEEYENLVSGMLPPNRSLRSYVAGLQRITISIGAAVRNKEESAEHLIYRADKALYAAKRQGRNCIVIAGTNI